MLVGSATVGFSEEPRVKLFVLSHERIPPRSAGASGGVCRLGLKCNSRSRSPTARSWPCQSSCVISRAGAHSPLGCLLSHRRGQEVSRNLAAVCAVDLEHTVGGQGTYSRDVATCVIIASPTPGRAVSSVVTHCVGSATCTFRAPCAVCARSSGLDVCMERKNNVRTIAATEMAIAKRLAIFRRWERSARSFSQVA